MPIIEIPFEAKHRWDELTTQEQQLVLAARSATETAYAPYSGFCVGAAILLANGEVVQGSNQENAAYPSGLCAERVALFKAGSSFPNEIMQMIAVVAKRQGEISFVPASPCGACRQVMVEFEYKQKQPMRVIFQATPEAYYILQSTDSLLPFQFNKDSL